jgi:protoporphyrinogen oxidase
MKIAVIGAGFTGLTAAYHLAGLGHEVEVFEQAAVPGGLAMGFTSSGWDWALEKHYHHLFVSDAGLRELAAEIGVPITFTRPQTSTFYAGGIYQLDSALSLLRFPHLSLWDRFRTGFGLALLKFNPFWQPLEKLTSEKYIRTVMGNRSWEVIWEPLFRGKFADSAEKISAAWFWARIFKRSEKLGYPEGGFANFISRLASAAAGRGVKLHYSAPVARITSGSAGAAVTIQGKKPRQFSAVICTLPSAAFAQMTPDLPVGYRQFITAPQGIGAVNLVLSLTRSFLTRGTYWLNINDRSMPYLAVVEHTNFITSGHYAGNHLLYIGNYLPADHEFFRKTPQELLRLFTPHLRKINPDFSPDWVNASWIWQAKFAQPVVTVNYSRQIPKLTTPLSGIYLANIQQVYPWDRGTNYAVELGYRVANLVHKDLLPQ